MSVQALSWVLEHSPTTGTDRLVMISIANHAGQMTDDGSFEAYPGVETIQHEARSPRKRTINEALARLERDGAIERVINGAPDTRIRPDRRPNLYRILTGHGYACGNPRCGTCTDEPYLRGDESRQPADVARGDASRRRGVTHRAERGDAKRPNGVTRNDTRTIIEPSDKPSVEPMALDGVPPSSADRARAITMHVFENRKPKPVTPFVGVQKIAKKLLDAGHDDDTVRSCMMAVRTISTGWCESWINDPKRRPAARRGVDTDRGGHEGGIDL